jgi:hypothetical protein
MFTLAKDKDKTSFLVNSPLKKPTVEGDVNAPSSFNGYAIYLAKYVLPNERTAEYKTNKECLFLNYHYNSSSSYHLTNLSKAGFSLIRNGNG